MPNNSCTVSNLNSLLDDIYLRYVKLREFELHYSVFHAIFYDMHSKMKQVCPYYRKYSSAIEFAGSHFDNLRIKKPDEFDMDIVIRLPLNYEKNAFNPSNSDINLESNGPGHMQIKMGVQFEKLPIRDGPEWQTNKIAYGWGDKRRYLLRSKFSAWFEGVVNQALNQYTDRKDSRPVVYVDGVPYVIHVSKSGPAMTLLIRNHERNFNMDVDLVPALRFPESRWPINKSYRPIPPECSKGYWLLVPKANKEFRKKHKILDQARVWSVGLLQQESELLKDSYNLKVTIRLMKKLRDTLEMHEIASYCIKTLFFWEIIKVGGKQTWQENPAVLFKRMVKKLFEALATGKIPDFWIKKNNLIGGVSSNILDTYAMKLKPLMDVLEKPAQYKEVAKYLLTDRV